jgi:hypothetical protein
VNLLWLRWFLLPWASVLPFTAARLSRRYSRAATTTAASPTAKQFTSPTYTTPRQGRRLSYKLVGFLFINNWTFGDFKVNIKPTDVDTLVPNVNFWKSSKKMLKPMSMSISRHHFGNQPCAIFIANLLLACISIWSSPSLNSVLNN